MSYFFVVSRFRPDATDDAEGAENFKKVATDKRSLADVTAMVKKANNKLQELQVMTGGSGSY